MKIIFLVLFVSLSGYSQTTAIPDPFFEQALIDLGIDSDGIINGQVLTSDIDTITTLNVNYLGIEDLTGLEDFTALEYLDVSGSNLSILDVSNNIQLKELYCNNVAGFMMSFPSLDLSNNISLEILQADNLFSLESLNLKNGNNSIITDVILWCEWEAEDCELHLLHCVTVDDEDAANNDEFPYTWWEIRADYFVYSEDCTLAVEDNLQSQFVIYPNPTRDIINISSQYPINKIKVFDTLGRLVLEQDNPSSQIDVSSLPTGLLFIKIETDQGILVKKIIKE